MKISLKDLVRWRQGLYSGANSALNATNNTNATALFRELLLEGNYGTESASQVKGFTASLRFDRGADDYFIIDIPNSQAGTLFNTAVHTQICKENQFLQMKEVREH